MIKKILASILVLLGVFVVYFGQARKAEAACTYSITRMDTQSSVTSNGTLNFNYVVKKSGTSTECSGPVQLNFYARADYQQFMGESMVPMNTIDIRQVTPQFNGDTAQGSFSYSLSGFQWCNLAQGQQNRLSLFMRVYDRNSAAPSGPSRESGDWPVQVTGTTCVAAGSGGTKTLSLTFDRSTYNKGEYADVYVRLSDTSGAKNVEMVTYVGSQVVGSFQVSAAALGTAQTQRVTVGTNTGFVDGANTIRVVMYEAGSNRNIKFAEGSSSVQAAGLGTTGGAGGGGAGGGGAGGGGAGGGGAGGGGATGDTLINPLPVDNLTGMFLYIVKGFLGIIGIWGVLFVIVGGFRMVMAAGNEEQYLAAKKTITWAILGVLIAVMSFSIIAIVQNLVGVDYTKIQNAQPK